MRRLAIILLISVLAAARGRPGGCGEFRSARTAPEATAALGFMSGLNTSRLASGWVTKNMASMSVEELEIAIAKYCNDHPLGSFNHAVMDVYFSLQNSDY